MKNSAPDSCTRATHPSDPCCREPTRNAEKPCTLSRRPGPDMLHRDHVPFGGSLGDGHCNATSHGQTKPFQFCAGRFTRFDSCSTAASINALRLRSKRPASALLRSFGDNALNWGYLPVASSCLTSVALIDAAHGETPFFLSINRKSRVNRAWGWRATQVQGSKSEAAR